MNAFANARGEITLATELAVKPKLAYPAELIKPEGKREPEGLARGLNNKT